MELDLRSFFGLHVTWCLQLYSFAGTLQPPHLYSCTRALLAAKICRRHLSMTPWGWVLADFVNVPWTNHPVITFWGTEKALFFKSFLCVEIITFFSSTSSSLLKNAIILDCLLTYRQSDITKTQKIDCAVFSTKAFFHHFSGSCPFKIAEEIILWSGSYRGYRDILYTNILYTEQSLYVTKFIQTLFIRNKIYTGQSLYGNKMYT